jgi:hypothetical protein
MLEWFGKTYLDRVLYCSYIKFKVERINEGVTNIQIFKYTTK